MAYAPLYYPDATDLAGAQVVTLAPGDERRIDFRFQPVRLRHVSVSGIVQSPDGVLPLNLRVVLARGSGSMSAPVDRSSGAFTFRRVVPGWYMLETSPLTTSTTPHLWGSRELFVDRDLTGVVLFLAPLGAIDGRVMAEPSLSLPPNVRLALWPLTSAAASPPRLMRRVDADGRVLFEGVPPGRYRLEVVSGMDTGGLRVASQIVDGRETIDAGLEVRSGEAVVTEIVLAIGTAQMSGMVRDAGGGPSIDSVVVLFARDPRAWTPPSSRVFAVRPDQDGHYVFSGIPPGTYLIAAMANAAPGDWFDPARLDGLAPIATEISVRSGDRQTVELVVR